MAAFGLFSTAVVWSHECRLAACPCPFIVFFLTKLPKEGTFAVTSGNTTVALHSHLSALTRLTLMPLAAVLGCAKVDTRFTTSKFCCCQTLLPKQPTLFILRFSYVDPSITYYHTLLTFLTVTSSTLPAAGCKLPLKHTPYTRYPISSSHYRHDEHHVYSSTGN
jgi:hypothetical protein